MSIPDFSPKIMATSVGFLVALVLAASGCEQAPLKPLTNAPDAEAELVRADEQAEDGIQRTEGNFLAMVGELDGVVIVSFGGPHCPNCRQLEPELDKVVRARPESVSVLKVNVEASQNRDLAAFFGVNIIPRMLVFKDGQPIGWLKGYQSAAQILIRLKEAIKAAQIAAAE